MKDRQDSDMRPAIVSLLLGLTFAIACAELTLGAIA